MLLQTWRKTDCKYSSLYGNIYEAKVLIRSGSPGCPELFSSLAQARLLRT